jgi:hypothetical protein
MVKSIGFKLAGGSRQPGGKGEKGKQTVLAI